MNQLNGWMLTSFLTLAIFIAYAVLSFHTLNEATIYEHYQPLFTGLANNSLKVVPENWTCTPGGNWNFNQSNWFVNSTRVTLAHP